MIACPRSLPRCSSTAILHLYILFRFHLMHLCDRQSSNCAPHTLRPPMSIQASHQYFQPPNISGRPSSPPPRNTPIQRGYHYCSLHCRYDSLVIVLLLVCLVASSDHCPRFHLPYTSFCNSEISSSPSLSMSFVTDHVPSESH